MSDGLSLSFLVPPAQFERLKRSPSLRAGRQQRAVTRSYRLAVFDDGTFSHRARPVIEEIAAGDAIAEAADDDAPTLLAGSLTRTRRLLAGDTGQEIAAELEYGTLSGPLGSLPIARLTLVQEKGDAAQLLNLADSLRAEFLLRLVTVSEVERGYSVLTAAGPTILRARESALAVDMTTGQAAALVLRNCLSQWLGNELAVRAGAVEGVHQMRVALRRLRASLELFGGMLEPPHLDHLEQEARWLGRLLGSARDCDVFLEATLRPVMLARPKDPALEAMREAVELRRTAAYEEVRHALDSPRAAALAFDVAAASAEIEACADAARPIVTLARQALDGRFDKVLRRGRRLRKLDVEQRHQLRIQLKKLRYGVDFFSSLFSGRKRKKFAANLAELQDLFGALNDAATAERLTADLYGLPGQATGEQTLACGLVIGWHLAESRQQHQRLVTLWGRWADGKPFWR